MILLLGAIALHRAVYGLELVAAFSLGLGLTLIMVGAIAIYCRQWLDRFPQFKSMSTYFPLISAALISFCGGINFDHRSDHLNFFIQLYIKAL